MIEFKKRYDKYPEHLYSLSEKEDILEIKGFEKINLICTQFAITKDLKYIVNTDSCDYYQFKKFNKKDILMMIEDLKQLSNMMENE